MDQLINFLSDSRVKGIVAIICVILMEYTPDEIDKMIEAFMGFYGIAHLLPRTIRR